MIPRMKPIPAIVVLFGPIETPAADLICHCLTLSAEFIWSMYHKKHKRQMIANVLRTVDPQALGQPCGRDSWPILGGLHKGYINRHIRSDHIAVP